ncbi:hypothetical protein GEMRC1_000286 [Eukaryota sp. GEM-RC1]
MVGNFQLLSPNIVLFTKNTMSSLSILGPSYIQKTFYSTNPTSKTIRLPQSLLVLIHLHLLNRYCESLLEKGDPKWITCYLTGQLHSFIPKFGYTSQSFFKYSFIVLKVFLENKPLCLNSSQLHLVPNLYCLFRTDVLSVFVNHDQPFPFQKCLNYSHIISGVRIQLRNPSDLKFLDKSSPFYFPHLRYLDLNVDLSTLISLCTLLKTHLTITDFSLYSSSVGDEGAAVLASMLTVNSTITRINLAGNSIGNEGIKTIAGMLKVNCSLTEINLELNYFETEGAWS